MSRDFFDLIKLIGEARSKQEELGIIEKEARTLKGKIKNNAFSMSDPKVRIHPEHSHFAAPRLPLSFLIS